MATFQDLLNQRRAAQSGRYGYDQNYGVESYDQSQSRLTEAVNQFNTLFRTYVGRDPDETDRSQFIDGILADPRWVQVGASESLGLSDLRDPSVQFIQDRFQRQAEQQATLELQNQQTQANSLANLFRTQGQGAIDTYRQSLETGLSETESGLIDFQNRLFERLRPQLLTSLQAQGLLNTGGLNEAFSGAAKDLSDASQQSLLASRMGINEDVAQRQLENEQAALAISQGAAADPYNLQRQLALNRVPNFMQAGQDALTRAYQDRVNEMQYNRQYQLAGLQNIFDRDNQPSFLRTFSQNAAGSLGKSLGQWASPNPSGGSGSSGDSALALALLSSKTAKKDITKLTETEENELYDRLVSMPLNRYRYKTEPSDKIRHLGVMTEEAIPEIVMDDKIHLSIPDYFGILTLALKVQHRRYIKRTGSYYGR
jgi:hypothetical protein